MSWVITGKQKHNWSPEFISTFLWLDASDASTITLTDGVVEVWADKSGNGFDALQGTPDQRFAYDQTLNGLNVVTSNSSSMRGMAVPAGVFGFQSAFIVYNDTSTAQYTTPLGCTYLIGSDTGTRGGFFHGHISDSQLFSSNFTKSATLNGSNFKDGTDIGDGTSTPRPDTHSVFSFVATDPVVSQNALERVGSDPSNNRRIIGDLAEIILLEEAVSESRRQAIEGYLAHKWGLTANLPADHPYKTLAPLPGA